MDALVVYLIFAITTAICTWLFYYAPVLAEAKRMGIVNSFTNSPIISSLVYIVISTFIAPSLIIPLFNKYRGELFSNALRQEMLKQD